MNADCARVLAEEYFNGGRDRSVEVAVHAFEGGYVAWARDEEPADPSVLPGTVGGGCIVIDRITGEVAVRPLLGPELVAAEWPGRTPG
ncbi:hypothetical protein [Acrocarpospora catenulata]|uniref:hypothetical protein n=1 Tax=Acrocarpospora catenulata TaxID=2836182 RepID=UPI001BDA5F9B|nr:hypothetical protein [Acrocarpospora catenulata]